MKLNINTALITSKQRGNQNIIVLSNYFWFDYALKPYISYVDLFFKTSEEEIKGKRAVFGYFNYFLLNIAHNHNVRPDTFYPAVLSEYGYEEPFLATPIAKKGLVDLFMNVLPAVVDGFAVNYRLVSDGSNIGFGAKDNLIIGGKTYKVNPELSRVMKLPDEDLLIKRANFPITVKIGKGKGGKGGGTIELPILIDGLFSRTLNKHIGIISEQISSSPYLENLPQDWVIWEDYRPVVAGETLDTSGLITPPDEDVLDFVNYLKNTYNKPVYLLVSIEFLEGCQVIYPVPILNLSQFINSLPVDGVIFQDDFSEGSWMEGATNLATSLFLQNLYREIVKPKFYMPSYSTVKSVSFQDNTVSINQSQNALFNTTKDGCIYTPPLIPYKECGYIYGGYSAYTCDHANYYLQRENVPVLEYNDFLEQFPNAIFVDEANKMYKQPEILLYGLGNVILKQHFFDEELGLVQFADVKTVINETAYSKIVGLNVPVEYKFSDVYARFYESNGFVSLYCKTIYTDRKFEVSHFGIRTGGRSSPSEPTFYMFKYLGLIYIDWLDVSAYPKVLKPVLVNSPIFSDFPIENYDVSLVTINNENKILFKINFGRIGILKIFIGRTSFSFEWQNASSFIDDEIATARQHIECNILAKRNTIRFQHTPWGYYGVYNPNIVMGTSFIPPLVYARLYPRPPYYPREGRILYGYTTISIDPYYARTIYHHYSFVEVEPFRYAHIAYAFFEEIGSFTDVYELFFSTIVGFQLPLLLLIQPTCAIEDHDGSLGGDLVNVTCYGQVIPIRHINWNFLSRSYYYEDGRTPEECRTEAPKMPFWVSRIAPSVERSPIFITEFKFSLKPAFYYQVYYLNRLAGQIQNKRIFWNAFYLTPFWQIFSVSQDKSMLEFYYIRVPHNLLAYFIDVEADESRFNCCLNPRIVRNEPPDWDTNFRIPIPNLLEQEQLSLNSYNYITSKQTTYKPYLIPIYEKFYRRVDKYNFLEPILAYVKGGHVSIIGQYNGIFAYTLPEYTDKVFLAVYRESANELILTIGEDLIMADIVEFEDPSLGILISQENPFVFYKTHITKTGKVVEQQGNQSIVRFVDLP